MSEVIAMSASDANVKWCIKRQPTPITDPMVVSFRKWNGARSLLNQNARWDGDGWDPKRWVPKSPIVPKAILAQVEAHMREVEG